MRSIFVLLILVMIGLNGKGQSVTALPDSVLSQCCLEVTLLNGNVTTVDWVFVQYVTRDGTGTKLFVEYAPNFGGIQWETQIRIQDDFDNVLERSKFIVIPFTVGSTDYGINRNWIANIEENTTTGGTWIYGRFGTPTKRKFSAVEDYETMKNLLLACRPRAIVVAENGLYTEGDTVRMGGFLIENTSITTEGYNWQMKDTLSSVEFGLDYNTPETLDTTVYWARRSGSVRQMVQLGRRYYYNSIRDTTGGLYSDLTHSWNSGDPFLQYQTFNPLAPTTGTAWFKVQKDNSFLNLSNDGTNPFYSLGWAVTNSTATLGASESGSGDPGNGVVMGAYGFGTTEYLFMKTKAVDAGTATNGQFLQLIDNSSGEVDFATIDLSGYLLKSDTAAMLLNYPSTTGWGLFDGGKTWRVDSSKVASRYYVSTSPTTIANNYIATSNGSNLVARNLFDNNTYVGILNSKPFQLGQWTTAGRPSGVTGYEGYNTVGNGKEWYQGSRWAYALESTFARGTATYFPYFDANGQVTNSILSQSGSEVSVTSSTGILKIDGNNGANTGQIFFKTGAGDYSNWIGTQDYNMTLRTRTTSQKIVMEFGSSARSFEFRGGGAGNMLIIASTPLDLTGINSITSPSFVPLLLYSDLAGSDQTGLISRRSTRTSDVTQPDRPIHSFQYGTAERARITIAGQLSLGGSAPDASSIVDIVSTARGFLLPRMNTTNRNAITSPASTLLLANTDSLFFEARISGAWKGIAFRDWVRSNFIGSTSTIYGGNGTIGTSRIATITDSIRFQFGGSDLLRLKSNGVLHVNMPTEASSFVITSTPNENYNNYRGQVFLTGTTSAGDTATATRRNNHEASYFSGINLVEGGNNVYYDAVAGYGNIIRGNQPKNIAFGIYNTINSGSDNGAYGFNINITGSNVSAFGRDITIAGSNITAIGRSNTITQNNSFVYGSNISGGTNLTQHGFGTVAPAARVHVKSISGSPTIYAEGGSLRASAYGSGAMEAADLSKTQSNYIAGFATDGTVLDLEQKRDTTIYIEDADYDFSAALTTAQVSRRYNRVIFLMTTTAAAASDSELTLHTPDANLMQVEYLIRSTDETGGFTNVIQFGSNNAVASNNTLVGSYTPSAGQGVGIRAGLRSGAYKYFYY